MITTLFLGIVLAAPAPGATVNAKVDGPGYFRFAREGRAVYMKKCTFTVKGGKLVNSMGDYTLPAIAVSDTAEKIEIDLEGHVSAFTGGTRAKAGRLVLALFEEAASLTEKEGVLVAADRPKLGNPGEDVNGVIRTVEEELKPTDTKPAENKPMNPPANNPASNPPANNPATSPTEDKSVENKPVAKGVKLTFANAVVINDIVTLGEVAEIDTLDTELYHALEAISLGKSPILNSKAKISRDVILKAIRDAGYKTENFVIVAPDSIEVKRESKIILASEFIDIAQKAVLQTGTRFDYELAEAPKDVKVPSGKITLVPGIVNGINTANANVKILIYQVFGEGASMKIKEINSQTIRFKAKVPPMMVKSGSSVKVVMKAGSAEIEMMGMARSTAGWGQPINVEVQASNQKTIHRGTVVADGVVEVKV